MREKATLHRSGKREIHLIPFQGRFIVYRPLARIAFLGNRAMADRALQPGPGRRRDEASHFLDAIGFFGADPPFPKPWSPPAEHRPTMAVLLVTTRCNLACGYCYARGGEGEPLDLTFDLAASAIDRVHENARSKGDARFFLAFHGGGEPTVRWDLVQAAVRHARSKDLPCEISMATNGVLSESQRKFVAEHFAGVSLSFDGPREIQNSQRPRAGGRGSFDAVMRTAQALDRASVPYGIRMTATDRSFHRIGESVRFFASRTGCKAIQVEPAYGSERGEYRDPTSAQARAFVSGFLEGFEIAARNQVRFFYSGARPWLVANAFCRAPENALVVTPEGDVVACFETHSRRHPLTPGFTLGRASATEIEIDRQKLEDFAARRNALSKRCGECYCRFHCAGDCAARCLGTPDRARGRCRVNRTLTRELLAWYIASGNGVWRGDER